MPKPQLRDGELEAESSVFPKSPLSYLHLCVCPRWLQLLRPHEPTDTHKKHNKWVCPFSQGAMSSTGMLTALHGSLASLSAFSGLEGVGNVNL